MKGRDCRPQLLLEAWAQDHNDWIEKEASRQFTKVQFRQRMSQESENCRCCRSEKKLLTVS